jgi:tetratricopeptide (TPR) repeat protein
MIDNLTHAMTPLRTLLSCLALALGAIQAFAQENTCGSLDNGNFGPYDYRIERTDKLRIVEKNHFAPQVAALVQGQSGPLGADLDFILRASPNHHRALEALIRLRDRPETLAKSQLPRPINCYFERALRFRPDDTTARMLFVTLLLKEKRQELALKEIDKARSYGADNAFTRYNLGLLYLDAGQPDMALAEAHEALALGFPRTDLRDRLVALGRWREPAASAPSATAASAPAASPAR